MEHFIETIRKYPCLWNTTAIEYRDQELKDAAWAEVMKETDLSSVKEVKLKWKKLRDSYRDALKRQSDMLAKEPTSATKRNYPWKYMGLMQFLQPYMNNRKKPGESPGHAPCGPVPTAAAVAAAGLTESGAASLSTDESDSEHDRDSSSPKRKSSDRLTLIDRKLDYLCKAHNTKKLFTEAHYADRKRETPPPTPAPASTPAPTPPDPLDIFFNSMCQSTKRFPFLTQIKIKKSLFNAVIEAEKTLIAEQQNYASLWAQEPGTSSSSEDEDRKPTGLGS